MSGRYLLDANVAIAILAGDIDLAARRESGAEVFLCPTALGELYFGAQKSGRTRDNLARVDAFAAVCPLLLVDLETARHYGILRNELRKKGRPIPENDIWIAATARRHGLILATRDGHFDNFEDIPTESW